MAYLIIALTAAAGIIAAMVAIFSCLIVALGFGGLILFP